MSDIFPVESYFSIFLNLSMGLVFFTLLHTYVLKINDKKNIIYINFAGYALLTFLLFYIGLREVSGRYFVDMRTYANHFIEYSNGAPVLVSKDLFFNYFMKFCSGIMGVHGFFFICALTYLIPMYRVSKVFFGKYWFYSFLMLVVSYSFWTYGVNGIRNGMATSLFLLGISYNKNKPNYMAMGLSFLLAILTHKTLFLPVIAYLLTFFYNSPKTYLKIWLVCIPLSLVLGNVFTSIFTSLGFGDDRLNAYLSGSSSSFRFDFLVYSGSAVLTGWYFIIKKKFVDKIYFQIFNSYLLTNAFWILVIRANFSNRFAYLSWFMMGVVIIYPFIKYPISNQHIKIGRVIFLYFAFTYFMVKVYYLIKGINTDEIIY